MKRILLPFFLFASAVSAHPGQILITHPQADVNYYCQVGQTLQHCIDTACSYATPYSCRVIAQNQNQYFIETYIPPNYPVPVVILPPPVIYPPPFFVAVPPLIQIPPLVSVYPQQQTVPPHSHREYRHRPHRR